MTSLAFALLLGAPAFAVDSGDIVVSSVKGEVRVTMNGAARDVRAGSVLELPATVHTGRDGAIELKQGATSVSVGPDTQLEFPALEKRGAPVDRIVQPRGNAFYDIGKREGRKLRVETPYLVGVIKGTQFNVAAQEDSTTISLFEGRLEVLGGDGGAIDLRAGEIASRRRGDKSISVIKMNEKAPAAAPVSRNQEGENGNGGGDKPTTPRGLTATPAMGDSLVAGHLIPRTIVTADDPAAGSVGVEASVRDGAQGANAGPVPGAVDVGVDVGNSVRVDAAVASPDVGPVVVDTEVRASVDVGGGAVSVDAGLSAGVDVGSAVSVDAGVSAGVDLGGGAVSVDAGLSTGVDVGGGAVSVDAGVSTGVDVGGGAVSVDAGLSTGVDVGPAVSVDAGANASVEVGSNGVSVDVATATDLAAGAVTTTIDAGAGVDLGTGGVAVDVEAGVAAGVGDVAAVDAGVDLGANVGAGAIDVGTAVDVGANVAGVDAGVSAGVDVGAGAVDLGLNVGNIDVGLGIDLGLDGDDVNESGNEPVVEDTSTPADPAPSTPGNIIDDVGGLLDGLLRRPGRR